MSADTADYVVMVVFGILLGAILQLFGRISAIDRSTEPAAEQPRKSLRKRVAEAFDREKARAENQSRLKSMPRSGWMAMVFLYGLIAMLVLVVKLSPITMRWWPFFGTLFGSFIVAGFAFSRTAAAARGKVDSPV